MSKKDKFHTVRALGQELLMPIPHAYMAKKSDTQLLGDRFPLLEAMCHQDHQYALYQLSETVVVVVRHEGAFWSGDTPHEVSYTVDLYQFNPKTWKLVEEHWYDTHAPYDESGLRALLADAGLPINEPHWLASDLWEYQRAQKRRHYHAWFVNQVKGIHP